MDARTTSRSDTPTATPHRQGTVLLTGATGDVGSKLLEQLLAAGVPLRVMVRRPHQVEAFHRRGVDAAQGSFEDPASLLRALQGCEHFFLLPPAARTSSPRTSGPSTSP